MVPTAMAADRNRLGPSAAQLRLRWASSAHSTSKPGRRRASMASAVGG